jgi:hypothetical protein
MENDNTKVIGDKVTLRGREDLIGNDGVSPEYGILAYAGQEVTIDKIVERDDDVVEFWVKEFDFTYVVHADIEWGG